MRYILVIALVCAACSASGTTLIGGTWSSADGGKVWLPVEWNTTAGGKLYACQPPVSSGITNPVMFWYDASDAISRPPVADGTAITNWFDLSGNSYTATQAANQLIKYVTNGINGRPAIQFNGNSGFVAHIFTNQQPFTIAIIGLATNLGTDIGNITDSSADDGAVAVRGGLFGATSATNWRMVAGSTLSPAAGSRNGSPHVFVCTFWTSAVLRIDNTSVTVGTAGTNALIGLRIGGQYTGSGQALIGRIGALKAWQGLVDDTTISNSIIAPWMTQWGM